MKESRLYVVIAIMVLMMLLTPRFKVNAQSNYVKEFYSDAAKYGHKLEEIKVTISVSDFDESVNGRTRRMSDGSIEIMIEREFYNFYKDSGQLKRLIYYFLGYELLDQPHGTGIMNSQKVYYSIKERHVKKLFQDFAKTSA